MQTAIYVLEAYGVADETIMKIAGKTVAAYDGMWILFTDGTSIAPDRDGNMVAILDPKAFGEEMDANEDIPEV